MAISRVKTWSAGEVLTASDLNSEFNNILNNPVSLWSPAGSAVDFDGQTITLDAAAATAVASSAAVSWNFISGAKTGTPATTGSVANWSAQTFTDSATAGSGTAAAYVAYALQRPTLAASNSSVTTTNAAVLYIPNNVAAGSNETLTNSWAIWVDAGHVRFDDRIYWLSGTASNGILAHNNTGARTYTFPDRDLTLGLVSGTEQASTSGTAITFSSIPSWVRRIVIQFVGVSTNGTSNILVQVGDSEGVEVTGYTSAASEIGNAVATSVSTAGFIVAQGIAAASTFHGNVTLTLEDASDNTWTSGGILYDTDGGSNQLSSGSKALSATLDRVVITMANGTDAFDLGAINILYQG